MKKEEGNRCIDDYSCSLGTIREGSKEDDTSSDYSNSLDGDDEYCLSSDIEGPEENNHVDGSYEYKSLHIAAYKGCLGAVKRFLDEGVDVDERDGDECTPLHYAAKCGYLDIVEELLSRGANINAEDGYARTPLHLAAQESRLGVLEKLLEKGADINAQDIDGRIALNLVIKCCYSGVVRTFVALEIEKLKRIQIELKEERDSANERLTQEQNKADQIGNITQELEVTKIQLENLEKELGNAKTHYRKQAIYASVLLVSSGAFAVGASLTISHLVICITLAVTASILFAEGFYCLYNANTALNNIEVDQNKEIKYIQL